MYISQTNTVTVTVTGLQCILYLHPIKLDGCGNKSRRLHLSEKKEKRK